MNIRKKILEEIRDERRRQIKKEFFDAEHDREHDEGVLAIAAACYAKEAFKPSYRQSCPYIWPWDGSWWKPENPRKDLIRAAALIVAELEKLDGKPPKERKP